MPIQITLEDHTGNISHQAKMDENALVRQIIPAIITTLHLPITDNAGRPITYHLSHNNRRLEENQTLQSAEVRTGDTLTIVPEISAGTQSPCQFCTCRLALYIRPTPEPDRQHIVRDRSFV